MFVRKSWNSLKIKNKIIIWKTMFQSQNVNKHCIQQHKKYSIEQFLTSSEISFSKMKPPMMIAAQNTWVECNQKSTCWRRPKGHKYSNIFKRFFHKTMYALRSHNRRNVIFSSPFSHRKNNFSTVTYFLFMTFSFLMLHSLIVL